jgi:hypothetical protein
MSFPKLHSSCTSLETSCIARNYPYGGMKTEMFFYVQEKGKKGYRTVTQSKNPKNGMMNKPHAGTYYFLPIYILEKSEGFFEFLYCPHYPDKAQEFINLYWKMIPEKDQKFIQTWYKIMILKNPISYKDLQLVYPE